MNGKPQELKKKPVVKALPRGSACSICRKRKLRCDGVRPSCSTCVRLKHDCGYGDPGHEKLTEQISELESRIRSLEAELDESRRVQAMPLPIISPASLDSPHIPSIYSTHSTSPPIHQSEQKPINYNSYDAPSVMRPPIPGPSEPPTNSYDTPYSFDSYPEPIYERPRSPQTQVRRPHSSLQQLQAHLQHRVYHAGEFNEEEEHSNYNSGEEEVERDNYPPNIPELDRHQTNLPHGMNGNSKNPPSPHLQSFPFSISNSSAGLAGLLSNSRADGRPVHPLPRYPPNNNFAHSTEPSPATNQYFQHRIESALPSPPISRSGWSDPNTELVNSFSAALPEPGILHELTGIFFITLHIHFPFLSRSRFLMSLNHPTNLNSAPSLALVYAILAIAAPFHSNPIIRAKAAMWYQRAREYVEIAVQNGIKDGKPLLSSNGGIISLTVEIVQALVLLTMIEVSRGDHQRCFMTISQAARIAGMLGLPRMDEDRIAIREGSITGRRLRPPSLHPLPEDPQLLEECRRSMCAVLIIDRFEAGCVGWPSSIKEGDLRLLLPCHDELYENATSTADDCPLWWPNSIETEEDFNPRVGSFAWLCRVSLLGGRIQSETYRASGNPLAGPFGETSFDSPLDSVDQVMEMDIALETARTRLNFLATSNPLTKLDLPIVMILLVLNCLVLNLHHLRVAQGLTSVPFDASNPIVLGSAEFSMQRCIEALQAIYEIVAKLVAFDKLHPSPYPRVNSFTTFPPYMLFCLAFPAKFAIGEWKMLGTCWSKVESNNDEKVERSTTNSEIDLENDNFPSGDSVFGPDLDKDRLSLIEMFVTGMERMSVVWSQVGGKFTTMITANKQPLVDRVQLQNSGHSHSHSQNF